MSDKLAESLNINPHSDRQDEIRRKKIDLIETDIESKHEMLEHSRLSAKINKKMDYRNNDPEKIKRVVEGTSNYLKLARHSKVFMNNTFKGLIPWFARNFILLTALSGNGKSTICANLALNAILAGQKVMVITNEEIPGDFFNRVICLIKGWAYVDHTAFTDEQIAVFEELTPILAKNIVVVDDNYNDIGGVTTTIEGFASILEGLKDKKPDEEEFGCIIIDYYQNINSSTEFPHWAEWKCQEVAAKMIDTFKKSYDAPIAVLAQLLPDPSGTKSFKERIEGRKVIYNFATCVMNVVAERDHSRTSWTIMKSRFAGGVGKVLYTGFDKGKYVNYTPEFANAANMKLEERKQKELTQGKFNV